MTGVKYISPLENGSGFTGEHRAAVKLANAAPELLEALKRLTKRADLVVARWATGDLADAVNSLRIGAEIAQGAIARASSRLMNGPHGMARRRRPPPGSHDARARH